MLIYISMSERLEKYFNKCSKFFANNCHFIIIIIIITHEDHSSWVKSKTDNTQELPKINLSNSIKGTQDLTPKGKELKINILF